MKKKSIFFSSISRLICLFVIWIVCNLYIYAQATYAQETDIQLDPDGITTDENLKKFKNLGLEEKSRFFNFLSRDDKIIVFKELNKTEKEQIFFALPDNEKKVIFNQLSEIDKVDLFKKLDAADRESIFAGLDDANKKMIFESLSDMEKKSWLLKFPGLALIIKETIIPTSELKKTPLPAEDFSRIEKILSGDFPTDISRDLKQYGYDFFAEQISAFEPQECLPIGADYMIGAGDRFTIYLWGKVEKFYDVTVTRDGNIILPRLGSLNVLGLTFEDLKSFLVHKFQEYYPQFEINITMRELRTINVYLVGEANRPGTHVISSLSTVIPALRMAGGPSKNGSLRCIKVIRNNKQVGEIDLYDFFIKGMKNYDIRLQTGDTIFIPVLGPVAGIAGNVRRPAIYELKGGETVGALIELAGGLLPSAYLQNIVIERIKGHQRRVVHSFNIDSDYEKSDENLNISLMDGDVVKIYPVYKGLRHVVFLEGHVKYPREYELKPGMKLRDLISSYDALLPEPYLRRGEIIRLMPPDLHPEIVEFNLDALLKGDERYNLLLMDLDRVKIYERKEKMRTPEVIIKGAVLNPGTYDLYEGMKIKDLLFQAGNLTSRAYLDQALLSRVVAGQVGADNFEINFSPRRAMEGLSSDDILLQPFDKIYIREIPQYSQALEQKVFLEGEFLFPGEYTFSQGERISSVIERAGGLTEDAYPFGAFFQRESVKNIQKSMVRDYISKLEEDIFTLSAQASEASLDKDQSSILNQTLNAKKQLLEKMKTAQPTGRMVVDLVSILTAPSSAKDFKLRAGDHLIVNKKPDYVNVLGEVYNPTAMFFLKDKTVGHYLNKVGGLTDNANEDQIYLVKANGTVISKRQEGFWGLASWDSENFRWTLGGFESLKVDLGDTIIVPKKVEKYPWLRLTKDITEILYRIAVSAGVIIVAY